MTSRWTGALRLGIPSPSRNALRRLNCVVLVIITGRWDAGHFPSRSITPASYWQLWIVIYTPGQIIRAASSKCKDGHGMY